MNYLRHQGNASGFMATAEPGEVLAISQVGEVWARDQWSIHWHTNPGWEMYYQVKGASVWEIEKREERVPEGGAYLIREGTRHRLKHMVSGDVHFCWVVFPHERVPEKLKATACWSSPFTILKQAHDLHPLFQGIIREASIREAWQAEVLEWQVASLSVAFTRVAEKMIPEKALGRHPAAERAMRLLKSRLDHAWRLAELAQLSGVSVPHLVQIFRNEFGQTPMRRLTQLRVEAARRQLAETEKTVTEIAIDLGFASSQHLARAHRDIFGTTPSSVRSKNP